MMIIQIFTDDEIAEWGADMAKCSMWAHDCSLPNPYFSLLEIAVTDKSLSESASVRLRSAYRMAKYDLFRATELTNKR